MDLDYEWFLENYMDIFQRYGESYVVIKNRQILGTYSSYADGVRKTAVTEELGTFIVQFCNGDESGYTNYIASVNF